MPLPIGYHQHQFPGTKSAAEVAAKSTVAGFFSTQLFVDLLASLAIAVSLSFLIEFVIVPAFPDLFPMQDMSYFFFLSALSFTGFYARLQYDEYNQAVQQFDRSITLLEEASPPLDNTTRARVAAALHSLLTTKDAPDLFSSVEALRNARLNESVHQLAQRVASVNCRSLAVLSRLSLYFWMLALPWVLWGYFFRFTIGLVPLILLPTLALRQFGLDRRTRSRQHGKKTVNPIWQSVVHRLARFGAPLNKE